MGDIESKLQKLEAQRKNFLPKGGELSDASLVALSAIDMKISELNFKKAHPRWGRVIDAVKPDISRGGGLWHRFKRTAKNGAKSLAKGFVDTALFYTHPSYIRSQQSASVVNAIAAHYGPKRSWRSRLFGLPKSFSPGLMKNVRQLGYILDTDKEWGVVVQNNRVVGTATKAERPQAVMQRAREDVKNRNAINRLPGLRGLEPEGKVQGAQQSAGRASAHEVNAEQKAEVSAVALAVQKNIMAKRQKG